MICAKCAIELGNDAWVPDDMQRRQAVAYCYDHAPNGALRVKDLILPGTRKMTWRVEQYELNRFDCNCRIVSEFPGGTGVQLVPVYIEYCPKHKAAPDMYEALRNLLAEATFLFSDEPQMAALREAQRALTKAEGRTQ